MKTYYVEEKWDDFQDFMKKNFDSNDQHSIGILASETEIYIRSDEEKFIKRIMERYPLIKKELPKLILFETPLKFRNNFGNSSFFGI